MNRNSIKFTQKVFDGSKGRRFEHDNFHWSTIFLN